MRPNEPGKQKQGSDLHQPFPWRCNQCGKQEVAMATIEFQAEIRHDGRLHTFAIPRLELPVCQSCGEKVFTDEVDCQVNDALRTHLGLMLPAQIHEAIERIGMSQKDVARQLGIAEESLSRWLNEAQIQSRSMDTLLRTYFAFPIVRAALSNEAVIARLGLSDVTHPVNLS